MKYNISLCSNNGAVEYNNSTITLKCEGDNSDTRFSFGVEFPEWEEDAYILLPACAYDGNRMRRYSCTYPPMYEECDLGIEPAPIIADVPALNVDGSGRIEVTTADLSVPCFALFYRHKKEALFIFTEQECGGKNLGFSVESGKLEIQYPAVRSRVYTMCSTANKSNDTGISVKCGDVVSSRIIIKSFDCEDIPMLFELFFEHRHSLLSDEPAENQYTRALWDIMEEHMNRDNFTGEYYAEMSKKWQCGWVGGGMSSLPLLKHGSAISKERAIRTIDFMTSHISPCGFFYTMIVDGEIIDDSFGHSHLKGAALTRKIGDALYFLFKHFDVIEPKKSWVDASRRCSDAFVTLYERYGSFGQFINIENGDMLFGGTTSGAPVISALIRAWRYFGDKKYLDVATRVAEKYYYDFVYRGFTYGGPGEALCAPDSESAYAMVECNILLYEATNEDKWLKYAKDSLHLLSSWVMPYSFRFPEGCEFARLKINTVGSVFANIQNKHSAPGLCTASGDAIYRLYKYTGNAEYLKLLRDIVFFIPQCVSTEERPILSWDTPKRVLFPGNICERVNTSDWEGAECVGGVFAQSCWCETSLLLSFSELIWNDGIYKELNKNFTE